MGCLWERWTKLLEKRMVGGSGLSYPEGTETASAPSPSIYIDRSLFWCGVARGSHATSCHQPHYYHTHPCLLFGYSYWMCIFCMLDGLRSAKPFSFSFSSLSFHLYHMYAWLHLSQINVSKEEESCVELIFICSLYFFFFSFFF